MLTGRKLTPAESLELVHQEIGAGEVPEDAPHPEGWPKRCSCCGGLIERPEAWAALPLVGYVGAFKAHQRYWVAELRNHACGSTIAVEVEVPVAVPA